MTEKKQSRYWLKVKSFFTAGKSRREAPRAEIVALYLFTAIVVGDVVLVGYVVNYASETWDLVTPAKGFGYALPVTYGVTNSTSALMEGYVSLNTTSGAGLTFLADSPITFSVRFYPTGGFGPGKTQYYFTFHDAEPWIQGKGGAAVIPYPTPLTLTQATNGTWLGRQTVYFIESGNYAPELTILVD